MFDVRDLFQWERFITPSIIRVFYTLVVIVARHGGHLRRDLGLQSMQAQSVCGRRAWRLRAVIGAFVAILGARIALRIRADHVPDERSSRRAAQPRGNVAPSLR